MGSKPKVVQQESPEEIERKAKELAQKESNENSAVRRKNKQSTALGSLVEAIRTDEEIAELRQAKQEQQQAMQEQQQQQALMSQVGQTGLDIAKDQAKNMTPDQLGAMFEQ